MKCPLCHTELPPASRFCSGCGATLGSAAGPGAPDLRKRKLAIGAGAAVIAAALGYAIVGGLLSSRAAAPPAAPVTVKSGPVPAGAPVTTRTDAVAPRAPKDVVDYLLFIKDIERQRVALRAEHSARLMAIMAQGTANSLKDMMAGDPGSEPKQTPHPITAAAPAMAAAWQQLAARMAAPTPPAPCKVLGDRYYDMLRQSGAGIVSVVEALDRAMQSIQSGGSPEAAAAEMSRLGGSGAGTPSHAVTEACALADGALAEVCTKFGIRKDYDIKDDSPAAGSVLSP